jgi:peptidoglycan hydrolase CwlO-like protein
MTRENSMNSRLLIVSLFALPIACSSPADRARADSAQALAAQQRLMMDKLVAQRDSVSRVLGDADSFIGQIDKSISRVKGLPAGERPKRKSESGIEDQLRSRKDMLRRVDALVARARETSHQVSELQDRQTQLLAENGKLTAETQRLRDSVDVAVRHIAELDASLDQQAKTIAALEARIDDLGKEISAARAAYSRAYYVIGTESELIEKGVVVKEGGTNLLIKRIGRTLVPARELPKDVFTTIDTRDVHTIGIPDTTRKYQIVSRQSLDDAKVALRDGAYFRGPLEIPEAERFWSSSRYLIIVQR